MKIVEDSETRLVVEDRPWGLGLILIMFILATAWGGFDEFQSGNWPVSLLLFGISGVIFWALNRYVQLGRLVLDKTNGTAKWSARSASRSVRLDWPLEEVRRSVVETRRDDGETYRITLLFDNGRDPLPLTPYFSGLGRHEAIKTRINEFLGAE